MKTKTSLEKSFLVSAAILSIVISPVAHARQQTQQAQPTQEVEVEVEGPKARPLTAAPRVQQQVAQQAAPANLYLDLEDAQASLLGMKLKITGNGDAKRAELSFRVFRSCLNESDGGFEVRPMQTEEGNVGFAILDKPSGARSLAQCQKALRGTQSCQLEGNCALISTSVSIPDKTQTISLFQENLNTYEWDAFPLPGGEYRAESEIRAEKQKAALDARKAKADSAWEDYEDCRGNLDDIVHAQYAIGDLLKAEAIDEDEAEKMVGDLTRDEAKLLANAAKSCKADAEEIRAKAQELARREPELGDRMASEVYPALIKCVLSEEGEKEVSSDDFETAQELLEEAGDFDTSSTTRKALKKYAFDLKIGKAMHYAGQGEEGQAQYLAARMKIQQELGAKVQGCMSRPPRTAEASAACTAAANEYQRIPMMLDRRFQSAMTSQIQMWNQMNQQQQQSGWGSSNFGSSYGASPAYSYGGSPNVNGYGQMGGGGYGSGITPFSTGPGATQPSFGQQQSFGGPQMMAGQTSMPYSGPQGPQYMGGTYGALNGGGRF
jgi:hypothetical protein